MENKKLGWAFGLGIFDGAYQFVTGLVVMLFASKAGGIPYGIALMLTGLLCAVATYLSTRFRWGKILLLMLGVGSIFVIFGLGYAIEQLLAVIGTRQGSAESIVLLLRIVGFYTGITLLLSALWSFEIPEGKNKVFIISSISYKVAIFVGIILAGVVGALSYWQMTNNAGFTEWYYGVFGDETLTGSALVEAQVKLRTEFVLWVRKFGALVEGIGTLLIALAPTYAWLLDSEGILFEKRSKRKTIIVTACAAPFLIVAELILWMHFLSAGSIASLVFAILTLVAYAACWFFFYWFPVLRGKRERIFVTEA